MAVLIVRDGRILLGKRGPGTREPGKWSFPAGFVERGERVERAAAREAREETGLDVVVGELIGLYSSDGETVVLAVYEATSADGEPRAGDDLTEVGWFATSELPELAFPRDRRIMDGWLATQRERHAGSARATSTLIELRGLALHGGRAWSQTLSRDDTPGELSRYGARGRADRARPRG